MQLCSLPRQALQHPPAPSCDRTSCHALHGLAPGSALGLKAFLHLHAGQTRVSRYGEARAKLRRVYFARPIETSPPGKSEHPTMLHLHWSIVGAPKLKPLQTVLGQREA
jgi:hypothetical protein